MPGTWLGFAICVFSPKNSPCAPLSRPFRGGTRSRSASSCWGRFLAGCVPAIHLTWSNSGLPCWFASLTYLLGKFKPGKHQTPLPQRSNLSTGTQVVSPWARWCWRIVPVMESISYPGVRGQRRREVCKHHHFLGLQLFPLSKPVLTQAI